MDQLNLQKIFKQIKTLNKDIDILEGEYVPQNIHTFNKKRNYLMFCGIGNPKNLKIHC